MLPAKNRQKREPPEAPRYRLIRVLGPGVTAIMAQ